VKECGKSVYINGEFEVANLVCLGEGHGVCDVYRKCECCRCAKRIVVIARMTAVSDCIAGSAFLTAELSVGTVYYTRRRELRRDFAAYSVCTVSRDQ